MDEGNEQEDSFEELMKMGSVYVSEGKHHKVKESDGDKTERVW